MADRTIWQDGVEVNKDDLEFEQKSRVEDIRKRTRHFTQVGILEGLDVKVNSVDNTKLDVSAGSGYCGSEDVSTKDDTAYGEYLKLSSGVTLNAPAGGWVVGTVYYVNLVYSETQSILKPHEDGVSAVYTRATVSPVVEIIKKIDYDALVDVEKQKRLRIAKVVPSSPGVVADTDIEKAIQIGSIKYASQPVSLTGVTVIQVSSDTTIGVGVIDFSISGSDRKLKWKNPGDTLFGAEVIVNAGGIFYLYANDGIKYIKVNVVVGALPAFNVSENITISGLYDKDVDVFSSNDRLHRSMVGTGIPSSRNPHGLTIDDIGGTQTQELKAHRNIQHANGIQSNDLNVLKATINYKEPDVDDLTVNGLGPSDYAYVYTEEISNLSSQLVTFTDIVYAVEIVLVQIYLKGDRTIGKQVRVVYDPRLDGTFRDVFIIDVNKERTVPGVLVFDANASPKTLQWDNGVPVQITESGEYVLYAQNNVDWIRVYVNLGNVPVSGSYSKTVSFPNSHIDEDLYLHICNVLWYPANGDLIGRNGVTDINTVDKRLFGTISKENLRSDVFEFSRVLRDQILAETRGNGIVQGYYAITATGTTLDIVGGRAYINGKRIERVGITYNTASAEFTANASNLVYLDEDGNFGVVVENNFTERMSNGKYRIPIWKVVLDSSKVILSSFDARVGIGLVSPIVPGQETVPFRIGPIRTLRDAVAMQGEDKCHAKWGDGVNGYTRIVATGYMWLLTRNLRWDGTNWYKDVDSYDASAIGVQSRPVAGSDEYIKFYHIPVSVTGAINIENYRSHMLFAPASDGVSSFRVGKDYNGNDVTLLHFFNPYSGSFVGLKTLYLRFSDTDYVLRRFKRVVFSSSADLLDPGPTFNQLVYRVKDYVSDLYNYSVIVPYIIPQTALSVDYADAIAEMEVRPGFGSWYDRTYVRYRILDYSIIDSSICDAKFELGVFLFSEF